MTEEAVATSITITLRARFQQPPAVGKQFPAIHGVETTQLSPLLLATPTNGQPVTILVAPRPGMPS